MFVTSLKPIGVFASLFLLASCTTSKSGEELAKANCSNCHQYTPPQMLDKTTWEKSVLPEMAFRMGLVNYGLKTKKFDELNDALPLLPTQPMVTEEEFKRISEYFMMNAPDSLSVPPRETPDNLTQFEVERVNLTNSLPFICMVKQDSAGRIFVGGRDRSLFLLRKDFTVANKFTLTSAPSYVHAESDGLLCLEMGIMDPNDKFAGSLVNLDLKTRDAKTVIDSLKRPVYFEQADLNGDHQSDILICEFGNYAGKLEVFEKLASGDYKPHVIESSPGSRKTIIQDFNSDGKPDILALFSQGNERINLYLNRGNFKFDASTILSFPAVYGSSYFEVHDFNGDGFFDILMTNGDNSDYSPILKPYHGVRIFENDGTNKFNERWFYPINGASWTVARDFDTDGDLDIAAITFFPDYKSNPQESFIYFENHHGHFKPFAIPGAPAARWLVMEAADVDGDTDTDLILGALDFKPDDNTLYQQWQKDPVALLVLKNKLRR